MMKSQRTNTITASIRVADMQKSLDFYTKTLGFQTIDKLIRPDGKIEHASVGIDSPLVMLSPARNVRSPEPRAVSATNMFGIAVEFHICVDGWKNPDEFFTELKAKGITVTNEPETDFLGNKSFTVTDPDGYAISFGSHTDKVTPRQRSFVKEGEAKRSTRRKAYDSIFNTR
jgi:uncharacterized glyoxalase superfamily protein PhnB